MTAPHRSVDVEDVDDVIGIASEMLERDAASLSVEDMRRVAAEVGIDAPYVDRAIAELERRRRHDRQQQATAAEQARHRRATVLRVSAAVLATILVVAGAVAWSASRRADALRARLADVERARAQVDNVRERQATVVAHFRDAPAGADRDAELLGAENRVRIERRRYDEVASAYNAQAVSFRWRSWFDLPGHVPLSNEVRAW